MASCGSSGEPFTIFFAVGLLLCTVLSLTLSIDLIPGLSQENATALINSSSSLLWGMVKRYPAGQAYRDVFDRLANSVRMRHVILGNSWLFCFRMLHQFL
jgi:hypothetical protein